MQGPVACNCINWWCFGFNDKRKLDEWEMNLRSLGGELERTGKLERVKILLLSYNGLPFFLKSCLLYTIMELTLQWWIVEGFILERERMTALEVARGYFNELVSWSLIQVAELGYGNISHYRVHDIRREIIQTKSREQNLVMVATSGDCTRLHDNIRHLAVYDFTENHQEYNHFKHLRSLVVFGYANPLFESSLSNLLSGGPKLLKVLDLGGAELKSIPEEVFELVPLKYLNLSSTGVEIIPQSIGKLQNLEYLNLIYTNVKEPLVGTLKLIKLREFNVVHEGHYSKNVAVQGFKAPFNIGWLHSLEILKSIDADNDEIVREIRKLTQLRELSITKLRREDGKQLCSSLGKLTNLPKLFVDSIKKDEILDLQHPISVNPLVFQWLRSRGHLEKVPLWLPSLQGLTVINLFGNGLREDPLESLQQLPNLMSIILFKAYEGKELSFKTAGFQKLNRLELTKL